MSVAACPQCANPCEPAHKFCPVCGFPVAELANNTDDPLIGTTLPGGYVILELVGVGGMGRVYRAEQKALGRTVAVKIIHPHLLGDENAAVRFITEARATSRLNHPNSVSVIDFGKSGGQLYLVMELLRGRDLARVAYEEGPLPPRRIVDIMCQVLAALAEAHHIGIIHRDLKPENIVLEPMRSGGDFVKVVDFGLAKMMEAASTGITSPGIVCGTPDYMAPEQGRGDPIDGRSDLYSVGVILFQLLTGRLPFEAESPTQVVLMHLSIAPPHPATAAPDRDIPDELADVTLRALEKDPTKRFQTADDFAQTLRAALTESDVGGRPSIPVACVACPSCRALVPRGQKFCGDCGARVLQMTTPPAGAAIRSPAGGGVPAPRLPLPFAAREQDLEWLEARRFDVDSSVTVARIVGDHGVGKTRLLRELLRLAAASSGDVVVETGADPWWAEVGYYALRKAIIELSGLPPDGGGQAHWAAATPEARRGLVEIFGKGETLPPEPEERRNAWSRIPPGTLTPEDRRFMAAEALRWAIMRAKQASPAQRVLLAIDDLHCIDGASRTAFSDVIAEPPLAPLLVVATHATSFDPGWPGGARSLRGLPTTIAASLVKGASPPRSSSGIENKMVPPLYIDQLVRFNQEGGSDPPARMADLVALRIERLPPDARRTLQAIAVIGDASDRASLRRLLPDIQSFDELLGALSSAGMVEERFLGAGLGPASVISTTHPLLREVALATIPAAVRRELHARAATLGEGDAVPQPIEARALHAYNAHDSFEALMLLEQVSSKAAARGDQQGAVLALRRGLDLARREMFRGELDDPLRAVLIFSLKLGEALARSGDLTDADGVLREALDIAGPSGPDRARILGLMAFVARERDRGSEASGYLREALELAKQSAANDLVCSLERMRKDWTSR